MRPSTPAGTGGGVGTNADSFFVDLDDTQNRSATGAIGTSGFNFVYLCTPFGLPRWAKYTKGPSGRQPRSPRGLVIASAQAPNVGYGTPGTALILPPCLQNGGNTASDLQAVAVLARMGTSASGVPGSLIATGGRHSANNITAGNAGSIGAGPPAWSWTLTAGTDFPQGARAVYVVVDYSFTIAAGGAQFFIHPGFMNVAPFLGASVASFATSQSELITLPTVSGGNIAAGSFFGHFTCRVPLTMGYELLSNPPTPPGTAQIVGINWLPTQQATVTYTAASLTIREWEMLDAD